VIAIQNGADMISTPPPQATITEGSSLVMLGTQAQRRDFFNLFDDSGSRDAKEPRTSARGASKHRS
jgi:K+/H+ antiporter YhaU regulatory subunit KhtT